MNNSTSWSDIADPTVREFLREGASDPDYIMNLTRKAEEEARQNYDPYEYHPYWNPDPYGTATPPPCTYEFEGEGIRGAYIDCCPGSKGWVRYEAQKKPAKSESRPTYSQPSQSSGGCNLI